MEEQQRAGDALLNYLRAESVAARAERQQLFDADAYRVLPMGFMPSCDVAQITAEVLTDFAKDGVECACYIDNFFFAGDSKAAVDAFHDRGRATP